MTNTKFFSYFVFLTITTTTSSISIALQYQQGIIYGRKTQNSIEYLG